MEIAWIFGVLFGVIGGIGVSQEHMKGPEIKVEIITEQVECIEMSSKRGSNEQARRN